MKLRNVCLDIYLHFRKRVEAIDSDEESESVLVIFDLAVTLLKICRQSDLPVPLNTFCFLHEILSY